MCLAHPTQGYYMNPRNPIFGAHGDFVTSPEISGIFGEVLRALCL
jgi:NADH dehydrogenase [ubiquinone] 1 alpha subcomplex assembly factor 7